MGRRVPPVVLLFVSALVTVAIFAVAPIALAAGLNALGDASEHSCGGP
jgi:hypothetical protein